jgi:hypothetical protein
MTPAALFAVALVPIAGCVDTVTSPRDPSKSVPLEVARLEASQISEEIMADRDRKAAEVAAAARKAEREARAQLVVLEADFRARTAEIAAKCEDVAADSTRTLATIQSEAERKARAVTESTGVAIAEVEAATARRFGILSGVLEAGQASGIPLLATGSTAGLALLGLVGTVLGRKADAKKAEASKADAVAAERARMTEHRSTWDEASKEWELRALKAGAGPDAAAIVAAIRAALPTSGTTASPAD